MENVLMKGISLIPAWIVFGHLGCTLHVTIERSASNQPGPADLDTFDAAFSHHAAYVFDVILELFGSLFCGDELIQIGHI